MPARNLGHWWRMKKRTACFRTLYFILRQVCQKNICLTFASIRPASLPLRTAHHGGFSIYIRYLFLWIIQSLRFPSRNRLLCWSKEDWYLKTSQKPDIICLISAITVCGPIPNHFKIIPGQIIPLPSLWLLRKLLTCMYLTVIYGYWYLMLSKKLRLLCGQKSFTILLLHMAAIGMKTLRCTESSTGLLTIWINCMMKLTGHQKHS